MHYQLEVIMPPTTDIKAALDQILAPFDENGTDEDGDRNQHAFWDRWEIGGRFSGSKVTDLLPESGLAAFYAKLKEMKITVSGLQCGKQEISPPDQIPVVDAAWREHFPNSPFDRCPLFQHAGNMLTGDVMTLAEVAVDTPCSHLIVAAPNYNGERLEAIYMVQRSVWNGVSHIDTVWDGTIGTAKAEWERRIAGWVADYAASRTPQPDWLVVTVDYHS